MSRWPIAFSIALMCAHWVVLFGVGTTVLRLLGVEPREILEAPWQAFVALAVAAAFDIGLVFHLLLRRVGNYRWRELGWSRFARSDLAFGLAGGIALVAVAFLTALMRHGSIDATLDWLVSVLTEWELNESALCVCIGLAAAFTEETLFRGLMQPAMQQRFGRTTGTLVTALVFAAYHGRFTPTIFLGKLGVGLVLGAMRDRTGTLWAPAIAHVLQWSILCFA